MAVAAEIRQSAAPRQCHTQCHMWRQIVTAGALDLTFDVKLIGIGTENFVAGLHIGVESFIACGKILYRVVPFARFGANRDMVSTVVPNSAYPRQNF